MNFSSYRGEFIDGSSQSSGDQSSTDQSTDIEDDSLDQDDNGEWIDGTQVDEIADLEDTIPYQECMPDQYYIGTFKYLEMQDILLFAKKIHISTFYKYSKQQLSEYLYWYSGIYICDKPHLEILQVKIDSHGVYSCIIKTFWLRIIQRRWKSAFHAEKKYINRNILSILEKRQRTGKPIFKTKLQGLLSHLSKVSK
jgi:hypothetical protein